MTCLISIRRKTVVNTILENAKKPSVSKIEKVYLCIYKLSIFVCDWYECLIVLFVH